MKIKAKRTNIEHLEVEVSKNDIISLIRKALGFGESNYVDECDNLYYKYTGDNYHNGDPEYDTRKATVDEIDKWHSFDVIRKAIAKES